MMNSMFKRVGCRNANIYLFNLIKNCVAYNSTSVTGIRITDEQIQDQPDKLYKTIEIEMKACEPATIKSYAKFASMAAECLGITIGKCWAPAFPHHYRDQLTILRSTYVHKKHRVQYEVRTYFRYMNFHYMTGSTADTFLEYIERNLPEGVALKITKVALEKLPEELLSKPDTAINETHT